MLPRLLVLALCLNLPASLVTDDEPDMEEIPTIGRPANLPFSEASGSFQVESQVEPTTVVVEKPLVLALRVKATGPVHRPPQRIDLNQISAFKTAFFLEPSTNDPPSDKDARTWEFRYLLRPRSTEITEIPRVPFVYYNPAIPFPNLRFQTLYTEPVVITVLKGEVIRVPLVGAEEVFDFAMGPTVLAQPMSWPVPVSGIVSLAILSPVAICLGWYVLWRRCYPDAARQVRLRRSRACRQTLDNLSRLRSGRPGALAEAVSHTLLHYFQERLDLRIADPTPGETADFMRKVGLRGELAEQALLLLRACDAARYQPGHPPLSATLVPDAIQLVLAVEAETCSLQAA